VLPSKFRGRGRAPAVTAAVETKRMALGDQELSYNELDGGDRPFVLLHGLTGHRDDFLPRLPDLADLGRLLVPDLRGHGDFTHTGREEDYTFAQLVEDTVALLDAWGIEHCDLLGHSFGGMVALRFALAYPERVDSLILMDTAPSSPAGYTPEMFEKAGAIARSRGMVFLQEMVEKSTRGRVDLSPSDRHVEDWGDAYWPHHRRRYAAMDPVGYWGLGLAMVRQESLADRLGEIRCPTTILVGEDDESFLPGADAFAAGIDGAVRETIPGAGHHPHMENPPVWLAAVRAHFARRGPGAGVG